MTNLTDEQIRQLSAVTDEPQSTDITWEEYAEWTTKWKIADKYKIKVWDQYDNKDTYKACSAYWLTAIFNWYQLREYDNNGIEFEQDDPRWKWLAFQAERGYPDSWASLQAMMSFFKKRWLIDWYVKCVNANECKNAINNGFLIYTWSNQCSWSNTNKNKEFTEWNGWAHCFSIIDYDDTGFIAINSFWEDWWDDWLFHINFDKYDKLYSTYAIVDHDDTGKLEELVYKAQYEKAIEMWITNWTRPDDPATRREVAVMIYRSVKK